MPQVFETQFAGRTLTIETGRIALLAGGSVLRNFSNDRAFDYLKGTASLGLALLWTLR